MTPKNNRVPTGSHRVRDPLNLTGSPSPPPFGGTRSKQGPQEPTQNPNRVPQPGNQSGDRA